MSSRESVNHNIYLWKNARNLWRKPQNMWRDRIFWTKFQVLKYRPRIRAPWCFVVSFCRVWMNHLHLFVCSPDVIGHSPSGCTIPRSLLENLGFCSEYELTSVILWFFSHILWFSSRILCIFSQMYVVVHGFPGWHHRFPWLYSDFCSDVVNMNKICRFFRRQPQNSLLFVFILKWSE